MQITCPVLILHGDQPSGVVRLNRRGVTHAYELSILVAPERYRLGIAKSALRIVRWLLPDAEIRAEVQRENRASQALFRASGFELSNDYFIARPHAVLEEKNG